MTTTETKPAKHPYTCAFKPPARVWWQTATGGWHSRDWNTGEKEAYAREVLGQSAGQGA